MLSSLGTKICDKDDNTRPLESIFPYAPYPAQVDVMRCLEEGLQKGGVTVIESPTGTGKTLMLLTAALSHAITDSQRLDEDKSEPEWIRKHRLEKTAASASGKENHGHSNACEEKKRRFSAVDKLLSLLPGSDSDDQRQDDTLSNLLASARDRPNGFSKHIVYASRTHAQLAQVSDEFRKILPPAGILSVTMAGRSVLCINDTVRERTDAAEACSDLTSTNSCPYFHETESVENMRQLLAQIQLNEAGGRRSKIVDVEEAVGKGRQCRACPYFAVRAVQQESLMTLVPYQLLFDAVSREASGISLKDSIVIIDEAHNLVDFINQSESKVLEYDVLMKCKQALKQYIDKYKGRLNGVHLSWLQQLLYVLANLQSLLSSLTSTRTFGVLEFMQECSTDTINLVKIIEYAKKCKLSYKLEYASAEGENVSSHRHLLFDIFSFLGKLSEQSSNGRIIILPKDLQRAHHDCKYVNVNPSTVMQSLIEEAHAIVLAGGTMSPHSDIVDCLFPSTPITFHSFPHIISSNRFAVSVLSAGPTNYRINLRFENRRAGDDSERLWQELGLILVNMARICPESMCVFFASTLLLHQALESWRGAAMKESVLDNILKHKTGGIFIEERERGAEGVEEMLTAFSSSSCACLFGVMGGRLSEGINLADGLCRALVLFGIPFANEREPEMAERVKCLGNKYVHNQCMRRVNQTIGRAIRHSNDWAYIVLVDERYGHDRIRRDLPQWMQENVELNTFPQSYSRAVKFFKSFQSGK